MTKRPEDNLTTGIYFCSTYFCAILIIIWEEVSTVSKLQSILCSNQAHLLKNNLYLWGIMSSFIAQMKLNSVLIWTFIRNYELIRRLLIQYIKLLLKRYPSNEFSLLIIILSSTNNMKTFSLKVIQLKSARKSQYRKLNTLLWRNHAIELEENEEKECNYYCNSALY